jgi:hypothetical protein
LSQNQQQHDQLSQNAVKAAQDFKRENAYKFVEKYLS